MRRLAGICCDFGFERGDGGLSPNALDPFAFAIDGAWNAVEKLRSLRLRHGHARARDLKSATPTDFARGGARTGDISRPRKNLTIAIEFGLNLQLHSATAT